MKTFGNRQTLLPIKETNVIAVFECECGNQFAVYKSYLKCRQYPQSCGYKCKLRLAKQYPAEYKAWCAIRQRCSNDNCREYGYYGGRGIKVCERWLESFNNFIVDVGQRPSHQHSIDRIDTNKDYEPSNVRWATKQEQALNRRSNRLITFNNETKTLSEWAKQFNKPALSIHKRLELGWSLKNALTLPKYARGGQ